MTRSAGFAGPVALALLFAAGLAWSWRAWSDPMVDFGGELYLAWQLSEGRDLQRDLAYRHGLLSPYWNAALFSVFGVSLRTLIAANIATFAAVLVLAYRLVQRLAGPLAAFVATAALMGLCGFAHYGRVGNYNFVAPYQHAQLHGLALSLATLYGLGHLPSAGGGTKCALGCGFGLGAVFLTKAELFVPLALATALALALVLRSRVEGPRLALALAGAALAPPAIAFVALALQMPVDQAWQGVLGNFAYLGQQVASDPFYLRSTGLDAPWRNLGLGLRSTAALLLLLAAAGAAEFALTRRSIAPERARALGIALGVVAFVALAALPAPWQLAWRQLARALPFVALAVLCGGLWRLRGDSAARGDAAFAAVFALYALACLGKMLLHARIQHYGFVLAAPALLLVCALAVGWLPAWLARRRPGGTGGAFARALACAWIAAFTLHFVQWSHSFYRAKPLEVTGVSAADSLRYASGPGQQRGPVTRKALQRLDALLPEDATLFAWPEGAALNYWLRRASPSRYPLLLPTEVAAFGGEAEILRDLAAHPPDAVALVQRSGREFGLGPFGSDPRNGRATLAWIREHYESVETIGAAPFTTRRFGIELLLRRVPER